MSHAINPRLTQEPMNYSERLENKDQLQSFLTFKNRNKDILELCMAAKRQGVHSVNAMKAAGFHYVDINTVRCDTCGLVVSQWTTDMKPFTIHAQNRPDCLFVASLRSPKLFAVSSSTHTPASVTIPNLWSTFTSTDSSLSTAVVRSASVSNEHENPSKRQKTEVTNELSCTNDLFEANQLQQVRRRTFSHWPHRTFPSKAQMIEAGFFNCNVGDRVICIYCNLICQQWTPHADDPSEVHKTLSPNCIYVKSKLIRREVGSILIVNENIADSATGNRSTTSNDLQPFRSPGLVHTVACNAGYTEIPRRHASFAKWPIENLPAVDDLVRAGFFFTGSKTIVTCFYCNGSLQNWGSNDNPMIEHARWFPHCAYAKQLCGDDLYRKIQESKRAQQERAKANETRERTSASNLTNGNTSTNTIQSLIPDESTLSRLVAARLDLPISQSLLSKGFKLSIIKRCWEDQLRLKQDDFESDCDLRLACTILQKQIERIDGKKENIIVPSIKMKQLRDNAERERAEALAHEQTALAATVPDLPQPTSTTSSNITGMETTVLSQSGTDQSGSSMESIPQAATTGNQDQAKLAKPTTSSTSEQKSTKESSLANPCVICWEAEKGLACMPCGHLATCVPCGHSLRSCPICRREIEAYVRIYV